MYPRYCAHSSASAEVWHSLYIRKLRIGVENNGLPGIVTSCCVDKAKGVFQFPRVTNITAKLKNGYFSRDESPL